MDRFLWGRDLVFTIAHGFSMPIVTVQLILVSGTEKLLHIRMLISSGLTTVPLSVSIEPMETGTVEIGIRRVINLHIKSRENCWLTSLRSLCVPFSNKILNRNRNALSNLYLQYGEIAVQVLRYLCCTQWCLTVVVKFKCNRFWWLTVPIFGDIVSRDLIVTYCN